MSETVAVTLTDFLIDRIAEDQAAARAATAVGTWVLGTEWRDGREMWNVLADAEGDIWAEVDDGGRAWLVAERINRLVDATHIARHSPARILADCAAKLRIVGLHEHTYGRISGMATVGGEPFVFDGPSVKCATCGSRHDKKECLTLRILALPYAEHPDYRDEWRP